MGEAYPFGPRSQLVLTHDNHNSVHGIREFARLRGAPMGYVPFSSPELRVDDNAIRYALDRPAPGRLGAAWRVARSGVAPWAGRGRRARRQQPQAWEDVWDGGGPEVAVSRTTPDHPRGLFAYPAQSHFSGVQHPLRWIEMAHERGFDVLLDTAAYVSSNSLDLSVVKPDFVPISWYKVFGDPTGVGCLIARRKVLERLWRPSFAGSSAYLAKVLDNRHTVAAASARFEDGTLSFLQMPGLDFGLSWVADIGIGQIRQRVMCLTGWLIDRLVALRHSNGQPMARIYGPVNTQGRGGTVAFNLLDPSGCVIDERDVAHAAAAVGISIGTVCLCNPGASQGVSHVPEAAWRRAARARAQTTERYLDFLRLPRAGALRASLGLVSNVDDVERFLAFLDMTYRDRVAGTIGLAVGQCY